jgi:DNA-directed RNA polymerase specialized sigma24 family protein
MDAERLLREAATGVPRRRVMVAILGARKGTAGRQLLDLAPASAAAILEGLPAPCREAMWLCEGFGFLRSEAAELLGCDEEAIERRVAEARLAL